MKDSFENDCGRPVSDERLHANSRLSEVVSRTIEWLDPTVNGINVPSAEQTMTYKGFTDTPEGRAARAWTDRQMIRLLQQQDTDQ